jgi:2-polyprenyl-3-methyl-5-hydroxy-6-metoxy-1,4-benzoquinol methylase
MSAQIRIHWDQYYHAIAGEAYPPADPVLFAATPPPRRGEEPRALDLACGLGQNGLWLAEQGYSVDLLDISREALRQAQAQAAARGIRSVNFRQVDLDEIALQSEAYDLICVFRFLHRDLFPTIRAAVKPGGRVVYGSYTLLYHEHAPYIDPRELLQPGELAGYFADWHLLRHEANGDFAQVVAQRPMGRT